MVYHLVTRQLILGGSGGGGGGEEVYRIHMERENFFQNFLINLWKDRVVFKWEYFFRKFHSPPESQLVCPLYSRAK